MYVHRKQESFFYLFGWMPIFLNILLFPFACQCIAAPIYPMFSTQQQSRLIPDIQDVYGVAFRDVNQDNRPDLYLVCFRGVNRLLINQGPGFPFLDATVISGLGGNLMPMDSLNLELGTILADFDNDGDADVLTAGWGETLSLMQNDRQLRFRDITQQLPLIPPVDANAAITSDVNGDGWLDIFITDEHFPNYLLIHSRKNQYNEASSDWGISGNEVSQGAAFCDVDLDGDPDLYVCNWFAPDQFYRNTGNHRFEAMDLPLPTLHKAISTNAVCFGDIDNDGDFDLIVTNREGPNFVYRNVTAPGDSNWIFQDISTSSGLDDPGVSYGCVIADFNHDGWQDVFITNIGANQYYQNQQDGTFRLDYSDAFFVPRQFHAYSTGAAVADADNDGDLDLFVANKDTFSLVYLNPANDSAYIQIRLKGVESNRDAIGGRIAIYHSGHLLEAEHLFGVREIQGGSGYLSMNDITAHFGLDTCKFADVWARFPSGQIETVQHVSSGQRITIYEKPGAARWWFQGRRQIIRLTLRPFFWIEFTFLMLFIFMLAAFMWIGRQRYRWHGSAVGLGGTGFLGFAMAVILILNPYPLVTKLIIVDSLVMIFWAILLIYGERLHQLHQDRDRYRHMLIELGNQVASIHDDDTLIRLTINQLTKTTIYDACCIVLFDQTDITSMSTYCQGRECSIAAKEIVAMKNHINNLSKHQILLARENPGNPLQKLLQSEILIAIQRGQMYGMLALGSKRRLALFSEEDKALFLTLANQLAVALENNAYVRQSNEMIEKLTEAKVREAYLQELEAANHKLDQKNQDLQHLYDELKQAESQLIQSEKMASLGQLVAGISHELNNPVGFIYANLKQLKTSIQKLESRISGEGGPSHDLLLDIQSLIDDALKGSQMVKTLVEHLRKFSHLDQAERKKSNIHDGIETCLMILRPQLADRIQVHCDFKSKGVIECNIGQLNQVFLNVIANAIQAIDTQGMIKIETRDNEKSLGITIRDNGHGMTREVIKRIFDPFYTTKDVGEGTGLGLSISYAIIRQHGGDISAESQVGQGTAITITLPWKP